MHIYGERTFKLNARFDPQWARTAGDGSRRRPPRVFFFFGGLKYIAQASIIVTLHVSIAYNYTRQQAL